MLNSPGASFGNEIQNSDLSHFVTELVETFLLPLKQIPITKERRNIVEGIPILIPDLWDNKVWDRTEIVLP